MAGHVRPSKPRSRIYNYILRRFMMIDLKIEGFKPKFAGKMSLVRAPCFAAGQGRPTPTFAAALSCPSTQGQPPTRLHP